MLFQPRLGNYSHTQMYCCRSLKLVALKRDLQAVEETIALIDVLIDVLRGMLTLNNVKFCGECCEQFELDFRPNGSYELQLFGTA